MARFRVAAIALLTPAALLVACNDLLGLSDFNPVTCSTTCPEAGIPESSVDVATLDSGAGDAPDSAPPFDGAVAATDGGWARWRMPNPDAGADAGWSNVASYTALDGGMIADDVTKLEWSTAVGTAGDAVAAARYCANLGLRLPTRIELASLIDFTQQGPKVDARFIEAGTPAGPYWTASPVYGTDGGYWTVRFDRGTVTNAELETTRWVRCVRGAR